MSEQNPERTYLNEQESHDLEVNRRKARRRMAWISYWFLLSLFSLIIYFIMFSGNENSATILNGSSSILIAIMTTLASIVFGYLGVSVIERIFKKD